MPDNQFIILEELSKTTQALLSKINEQSNLKVNKNNVKSELSEGTKIAEIEDVEIYAPIQEIDTSGFVADDDLSDVAYSGSYNDLSNAPSLATVATSGSYNDLSNKPSLATVATSGSYNDLSNKPDFMVKGTDYVTAGKKSGTTLGSRATAEGVNTRASDSWSHAEGNGTTASNQCAHAEGVSTTASGQGSHAEGSSTTASRESSHAEGAYTKALGYSSHAEGSNTTASGDDAHAEGVQTIASGDYSHAEGQCTTAQRQSQHTFGEFNILDTEGSGIDVRGQYVEIVGNGTSSKRSNARTLDWSGNEWLAGKLTIGAAPTDNMDVTTKQYVDGAITTAIGNVNSFNVNIVSGDLPTTDIDTHTIYFKPSSSSNNNVYDEYMYINNNWEPIGSTQIDLTPYALSANLATVATSGDYDDLTDAPIAEDDENVEDMLDSFNLDYTTTPGASINMWQGGNY